MVRRMRTEESGREERGWAEFWEEDKCQKWTGFYEHKQLNVDAVDCFKRLF